MYPRDFFPKSRVGKATALAATLFTLYVAMGFLVLPKVLAPRLVAAISDATHRTVQLQEMRINPLELSLALDHLEINEKNGDRFIGLDELYVNFDLSSLFRRAVTFGEIRLRNPTVRIAIDKNGLYNFADLTSNEPTKKDAPLSEPLAIWIEKLDLQNGAIAFADLSRQSPFQTELKSLNVTLNDFTTKPDRAGQYQIMATTGAGESLKWAGDLSVVPLRSKGNFELTGIRAQTLWSYVQDQRDSAHGRYRVTARY